MSVFTAFHSPVRPAHRLRAVLTALVHRLTASPLDNSVLRALGSPPRRPSRH
ncbi:hypothetical protein [Streptomyces sp. Y1]|uniref:Uncharacterized protein n=1 Tax=Streptomyces sp. Y1 TaxID=3238634 RepID=A0AB39TCX5_9ACTN